MGQLLTLLFQLRHLAIDRAQVDLTELGDLRVNLESEVPPLLDGFLVIAARLDGGKVKLLTRKGTK